MSSREAPVPEEARRTASPSARRTPAAAGEPAQVPAAPSGALCACGGGCPRCPGPLPGADAHTSTGAGSQPEREADRLALAALRSGGLPADAGAASRTMGRGASARLLPDAQRRALEPALGASLAGTRVHAGPDAEAAASAHGAAAYTFGADVVMGRRFPPGSRAERRLLAHELAHVAQQRRSGRVSLQRQDDGVVEMPALEVGSTLGDVGESVADLGPLAGVGRDPTAMSMSLADEVVRRNAPDPLAALPFRAGGWDADAILTALGQYDTMPGTDSDALRCVQAVGMAARVVDGPAAVVGYLRALLLQGMLSRPMEARQRTATAVLEHVIARIDSERATFGDLMWAQEAMHDLFYNDVEGTPEADMLGQLGPAFDLGRIAEPMDVWCDTPSEVMVLAGQLQPGEQLLVNTWKVFLNEAFLQLEDEGIEVAEGRSIVVRAGERNVRIRRLPSGVRPPHTAIDPIVRDRKRGHQLLVMRDGATGRLRLYEPEATLSGRHLEDLAADGSNFERYFQDDPTIDMYHYIQVTGKLTPSGLVSSGAWSAP